MVQSSMGARVRGLDQRGQRGWGVGWFEAWGHALLQSGKRTDCAVPISQLKELQLRGSPCTGGSICLIPADPSPSMTAAPSSRVYGVSLGTHLQELGRDIALPIEACVMMLLSEGMKEEVGCPGPGGKGASRPSLCPTSPTCCPGLEPVIPS